MKKKSTIFPHHLLMNSNRHRLKGQLTSITSWLQLCCSSLEGIIPSELGQLTSMTSNLALFQNRLTGSLPSQLGLLTELTSNFHVCCNDLSGTLPSQVVVVDQGYY
jgi:hypothetical protein